MSIQAVAWALEQDLPARPKLVLVSICNHASHTDGYCWLKAETIAKEAACTPRSVYTYIGGLVRNGFIRKALRKGDDGKQRANDYWLLFEREETAWDWGANPDADAGESEPSENACSETEAPDVVAPSEGISPGETPEPSERNDTRQPVEKHGFSPGPSEGAFTRYESLNHPSLNQKQEGARPRVRSAALRSYKPPPPQPIAADTEQKTNPVFVYEGTRAWEAWCRYECRKRGISRWSLTVRAQIEGKWRTGWYWPSLFPPNTQTESASTGPPQGLSDQDIRDFK